MKSKWFHLREKAIKLRKSGLSIRTVEKELGIPRSTLSGWFKSVELSKSQKEQLLKDWHDSLTAARKKAVLWHNTQKEKRIARAQQEALRTLSKINSNDLNILELALAILYLGEGSKKTWETSLGNSNPMILRFYIAALRNIYHLDLSKIRAELHLRADQDVSKVKRYWSKELDLPLKNFTYVAVDKRTLGTKTYPTYNGVCDIRCGSVEIQRRLIFLSTFFCEKVANDSLGS